MIRGIIVVGLLLLLAHVAFAQNGPPPTVAQSAAPVVPTVQLALTAQDEDNLRQVCVLAQSDPKMALEMRFGVSNWCLDLLKRMGLALSRLSAAPPAAAVPSVPPTAPAAPPPGGAQ
jgi:hypothetical protein